MYKYRLFGMAGTPLEYHIHSNDRKDLLTEAYKRLICGLDAYIVDEDTEEVTEVKLRGCKNED